MFWGKQMSERSVRERPAPLRAALHLAIPLQTPYIPRSVLGVRTCQHAGWPGQCCSGLTGLTNCLVYVCLSASWINLAWLDHGLSVCCPIIFPTPGPLNSPLPGQTCCSHVCCSCVTEGCPGQSCLCEAWGCFPACGCSKHFSSFLRVQKKQDTARIWILMLIIFLEWKKRLTAMSLMFAVYLYISVSLNWKWLSFFSIGLAVSHCGKIPCHFSFCLPVLCSLLSSQSQDPQTPLRTEMELSSRDAQHLGERSRIKDEKTYTHISTHHSAVLCLQRSHRLTQMQMHLCTTQARYTGIFELMSSQ